MAPKRKNEGKADIASENLKSPRVTRRSTRQASQGAVKAVVEAAPKTKKAKTSAKEKPESKAKPSSKEKPEPKAKTTEAAAKADLPSNGVTGSKTIVIEHCKQCTQFKIRAVKVKAGLETAVSGINVLVNPEKPRRGCFEVREEGGKTFISLLDMKRPFGPMKALDMDAVISDIIDQVK